MTKTLGQAVEFLSGGTPRKNVPAFWGGDIPWYSAKNMNKKFLGETDVTITRQGLDSGSRIAPKGSTLLLVRGSGLFKHIPICYCERDVSFNQDVKALHPRPGNDPMFIYFWLQSLRPQLRANLETTGIGAGKIDLNFIKSLPFPSFDYKQQQEIGELASVFDIKIDLNRRMNKTLEAMARSIFKDWFVDFGPTRAKAEGRAPYLAPEIWDLFPDSLDDEGKPVGWPTYTLSDLATHHRATLSPCIRPKQIYEHYSIPAYDAGNEPSNDLGSLIRSNKTIVPDGAILLSKLNPEYERVWLPNAKGELPQISSTEFLAFTPVAPASRNVLYCLFKSLGFKTKMIAMVTGTSKSHQRVSPKSILTSKVISANPSLLHFFDRTVSLMIDRILSNRRESCELAKTGDLLLPKFMSGDIQIADRVSKMGMDGQPDKDIDL